MAGTDGNTRRGLAVQDADPLHTAAAPLFAGPGEMRARCRTLDWAATPLGPVDGWPQSLRTAVSVCLASGFPMLVMWGPGLVQVYNDAFLPILQAKHPAGLGQRARDCWPELWDVIGPMYRGVLDTGASIFLEDQVFTPERRGEPGRAEEAYFTFSYSAIPDEAYRPAGILVTTIETTRHVQSRGERERALERANAELREAAVERERLLAESEQARAEAEAAWGARTASEQQFRTLADAIPTLAWTAKPDGHIDWYNARWYEYTGTTPAQMEGWGWQSVHDPAELPWVLDRWREGIATGRPVEMTFPLRGADGRFRPFLTRIVPLRDADGHVMRWFGTNTDVSPERAAREAVEAERGRLRLALDTARMVGWDYDLRTGQVTHAGDVGGVLGTDFDRLDGFTALVHPEDRARVQATYGAALAAGSDGHYQAEFRIVRPDTHAVRWVEDRGEVTRDADGRPLRFGGVLLDVTERRAAEAERERLYAAERAARTEAEAANQAKGQFLAVMSHELRTPLNAIGGYAELMEMGIRGPVTEQQREDLGRIQRSQRHLLGLVNEVLNYAKLETGSVRYDVADVVVCEALAGAEGLVAPQARARGLALVPAECAPDATVRADAEKLRQVLVNLLSNAIKFTEPGGRVTVLCACDGPRVRIAVRDTGIGIAADQLGRIFEPFVQVRADLTRPHEGAGLGLAISRDLARGMGGELTVESTPGAGSVFTLSLPRGGTLGS